MPKLCSAVKTCSTDIMNSQALAFIGFTLVSIVVIFTKLWLMDYVVVSYRVYLQSTVLPQETNNNINTFVRDSVTLNDEVFTYHLNFSKFQLEFPYLQNYHCSLIFAPAAEPKDSSKPLLILAVKSHPSSFSRRQALRQTWAREGEMDGYMVKPVFLLGLTEVVGNMELVELENQEFQDILQWDMIEGHHNLSLKEYCFLEWLHYQLPQVSFVFKGDDDEFVNLKVVVQFIKEHGSAKQTAYGSLQRHSVVMRGGKYRVSNTIYPLHKYPLFLSGGGFLYPGSSVKLLYEVSKKLPVFPLDDVYFGFLALAANVTLKNDSRFYVFGASYQVCKYHKALVVHGITPDRLVDIWKEVQSAQCEDTITTEHR